MKFEYSVHYYDYRNDPGIDLMINMPLDNGHCSVSSDRKGNFEVVEYATSFKAEMKERIVAGDPIYRSNLGIETVYRLYFDELLKYIAYNTVNRKV